MSVATQRADLLASQPLREVNPPERFWSGAVFDWRMLWSRRELWRELVAREIKSRYKESGLGLAWSLIRPLVQLLVYYLVIGRFLGASRSIPEFAIFVFTGLTLWGLINEILVTGTQSILSNAGIVKKVQLPREIFPLATVGSALFNFVVQFALLFVAAALLSGIPMGRTLIYIPLALVVAVVWATALALVLSALNVYLRDVQYIVEVGLMLAFWASPILYQFRMVHSVGGGWLQEAYLVNPFSNAILAFQRAIWGAPTQAGMPDPVYPSHLTTWLGVDILVGLVALFLAQRLFSRLQRNFAQEI